MAIELPSETRSTRTSAASRWLDDALPASPSRRWRRIAAATGLLACLAALVSLVASATPSPDSGPKLTYTIQRGDLVVTVTEQGLLESAENTEIKCNVRGRNTVIWVIESGTLVQPGDELVRLDTLFIQEQVEERTKYAHWSRSAAERSAADVARAELAVAQYEQGRYVSELMGLEKELVVAESSLQSAGNLLSHAKRMAESGYVSQLEVEEKEFAVQQARLNVALKTTEIDVFKRFTQAEELQTLKGRLASAKATHKANVERAMADASRRDRGLEEIQHCVVRAGRAGLVIHPNAAKWETAPIAEGATVHKDQVLLLMPDLSEMQVKVGIDESVVDRVKEGLIAKVTLSNRVLEGTVSSVASVTKPASWWTGNEVRYDTLISLPAAEGLRPGTSAEVEVTIARHEDVVSIPVAAIVDTDEASYCWLKTAEKVERREIALGDSNGVFTVVRTGLEEGDEVVLNPLAIEGRQSPPVKSELAKQSVLTSK